MDTVHPNGFIEQRNVLGLREEHSRDQRREDCEHYTQDSPGNHQVFYDSGETKFNHVSVFQTDELHHDGS